MKLEVLEEKENPVLKRKEIIVSLDYQQGSTPSKADLQKAISEQLNANMENIEVSKILSESGISTGKAWIKIWQERKIPAYVKKKAEAKEEAPKEKPAEQPTEEPKEEQAKEAKQEGEQ